MDDSRVSPNSTDYTITAAHLGRPSERYPGHFEALYRIQRALVGHVSFLAAADANAAFTEYLLYEPILRVLMTQGYEVETEVECDYRGKISESGDYPKLDFLATHQALPNRFALEVKWPRLSQSQAEDEKLMGSGSDRAFPKLNVSKDTKKLGFFVSESKGKDAGFLCIFGRWSHLGRDRSELLAGNDNSYKSEVLVPIVASFVRTQFACRIFEREPDSARPTAPSAS